MVPAAETGRACPPRKDSIGPNYELPPPAPGVDDACVLTYGLESSPAAIEHEVEVRSKVRGGFGERAGAVGIHGVRACRGSWTGVAVLARVEVEGNVALPVEVLRTDLGGRSHQGGDRSSKDGSGGCVGVGASQRCVGASFFGPCPGCDTQNKCGYSDCEGFCAGDALHGHLLWFRPLPSIQGGIMLDHLLSLLLVRAEGEGKSGHALKQNFSNGRRAHPRRPLYRNHCSVESLGQW